MKSVFSQIRVTKAILYVTSGVGANERGFHAVNMAPKDEFEVSAKTSFTSFASLPGTRMSRIGRMISAEWHPTGSSERNWFKVDSAATIFDYCYRSESMDDGGKSTATYPVELVMDFHVKLRGVNYSKLASDALVTTPSRANCFIGHSGF